MTVEAPPAWFGLPVLVNPNIPDDVVVVDPGNGIPPTLIFTSTPRARAVPGPLRCPGDVRRPVRPARPHPPPVNDSGKWLADRWARRGDRVAILHDPIDTPRKRHRWAAKPAAEIAGYAAGSRRDAAGYLARYISTGNPAYRDMCRAALYRAIESATRARHLQMLADGEL